MFLDVSKVYDVRFESGYKLLFGVGDHMHVVLEENEEGEEVVGGL